MMSWRLISAPIYLPVRRSRLSSHSLRCDIVQSDTNCHEYFNSCISDDVIKSCAQFEGTTSCRSSDAFSKSVSSLGLFISSKPLLRVAIHKITPLCLYITIQASWPRLSNFNVPNGKFVLQPGKTQHTNMMHYQAQNATSRLKSRQQCQTFS